MNTRLKFTLQVVLSVFLGGPCLADVLYLSCQVDGKDSIIMPNGYGIDENRIGPATITVKIDDTSRYISIDITGPRPFNNTSAFYEKGNSPTPNSFGIVNNDLFKVVDTNKNFQTTIDINRISTQITVSEKYESDGQKMRMNFSGFCNKIQNQKF